MPQRFKKTLVTQISSFCYDHVLDQDSVYYLTE